MKSIMKQYPLVSYFALAYLLSWLLWVPLALADSISEVPEGVFLLLFVGIWGPTVAGFIMTRVVDGREGVSKLWARYRNWRVGFQWYLVVFFAVPVLLAGGMAIYAFQGNSIGQFEPKALPLALLVAIPAVLFGPLGEEGGWRGFALPRLQDKYSAFWSSIILGILHTFWHLPLFWLPGGTPISGGPVTLVGVVSFLSMVNVGTFIYTWVFNHTKGSMLMAVLLHLSLNTTTDIVFAMFPDISEAAQYHIQWELGNIPGWTVVVLLLILFGAARLSRQPIRQEPAEG
jgi:membrane protease YdiL (CAAX protease family)